MTLLNAILLVLLEVIPVNISRRGVATIFGTLIGRRSGQLISVYTGIGRWCNLPELTV
ncbi:hypothetical protein LPW36_10120 [Jinshanibacter sp. LJY008]|uniref:Uncharacterized protein n=1 Tax=Limnobaculum eriocheiris TaxID=2897391 RepID=A0A9X1SKV3_9GAMM|nr:hypothetical protein [Limnobaculum eriocheiris]MCD1126351.1 hypothetical protein [Limnobaculum eriocheiris]